ncbi:hypothetical protein Q3O43_29735 (plasmid) [Rhodococcus aetherivorans]|uniref:hypothetical protein n=1 Tax=Rhodococcus aetherivorans TaxID=191292 RepID=UPI0026EB0572|nr:hypothetical protein [Rhodococcus aetherivorans]WKX02058.1 hypothetical protein Q3O43_29735 [Rhodococcus aetherivorans]
MPEERPEIRNIRVYLHEIVMFGRISERAITQLEAVLVMPNTLVSKEAAEEQQTAIAASVQQILYASAMVSKFLWPILDKKKEKEKAFATARGARLRELLGIDTDDRTHPLNSREVRDSIEHYDERLDAFVAKDYNTFVFNDWTIGSAATIETFGTDNSSPLIRVIDRDNLVIRHLGRDRAVPEYTGGQASVIDLKAQNAALQDLCRTAAKILDEGA